jgi:hypothetical protein
MIAKLLKGNIDRIVSVAAAAVFLGSLLMPWRLNSKTGDRRGIDLLPLPWNDEEFVRIKLNMALRPANDARWLWFAIVAVFVLTVTLCVRRRSVAILAGAAALGFLFLFRRVLEADFIREFGADASGQFFERETWSTAGLGLSVAAGAVIVRVCVTVIGIAVLTFVKRNSRNPLAVSSLATQVTSDPTPICAVSQWRRGI